jgi:hypothetical protein
MKQQTFNCANTEWEATPPLRQFRKKFREQHNNAIRRKKVWNLALGDFMLVWWQSGKWHMRGRKVGCECMSRIGDTGAYERTNVFIQPFTANVSQGSLGKARPKSVRDKIGKAIKATNDKLRAQGLPVNSGRHPKKR